MKCPYCNHELQKIPLTANMQRVLDVIRVYISDNQRSPSYEDIMAMTGLRSKSNVSRYIMYLTERGWLEKERFKARTLRLL